jgi:hypothetical protein
MIIEKDVYLAHYGKKGMRWGKRSARSIKIDKAREYVNSGKATNDRIKRTIDYRRNKQTVGRLAAWQIAKADQTRVNKKLKLARKSKNGKEFAAKVITAPLLINPVTAVGRHKIVRAVQK